jgi:predicted nucleotidyltransferase
MARQTRISLLAPLQERILALALLQPDRQWYRSELARALAVPASSLQRPLAALCKAEILRSHKDGNRLYYRTNTESPIFPELRGLLTKTSGLVGVLQLALEPLASKITVAFVFGSIATGEESTASDVDLLVVGKAGLKDLAAPLRDAAMRLGREISPVVFSNAEFGAKLKAGNHFLGAILDRPRLFVVGIEDDIRRASQAEARGARTHRAG